MLGNGGGGAFKINQKSIIIILTLFEKKVRIEQIEMM